MSLRRPRSSSDSTESERPTRRQRIEEVPEPESCVLVRDPIFYKDSGDCYIRVENHLFKVSQGYHHQS
jgi:hypothetical protein